ncbi:T9SS type A sorting domain-containing protein [Flavobacterium sp.]|uniref:DUF7619 domain-containing protein n=1 Tax=Flavobacterium sp. TaxID=239 RepID=UPI002616B222|nr:T9SS type A sorting domain-containing protein [Flavobacterium sp.]
MKNLYLFIAFCLFSVGYAQNPATVNLDLSFNYKDGLHLFYQNPSIIKKIIALSDGKILVLKSASGTAAYDYEVTIPSGQLIRLNSDYSLDTTFKLSEVNETAIIRDFDVTSDGGIIVVGDFTSFNGVAKNRIAKLTSNGEIDNSFNLTSGPGFNNFVVNAIQGIKVLPNGNILIGGSTINFSRSFTAFSTKGLARLTPTGLVDQTFQTNNQAGTAGIVNAINIQSTGKILFLKSGSGSLSIFRINENGTDDTSFYNQPVFGTYTYDSNLPDPKIAIQSDDKIIVFGNYTIGLKRLDQAGVPDSSFQLPLTNFKGFSHNSDGTSFIMHCNNSGCSSLVSKIDPNGAILWTKISPGTSYNSVFSLPNNEALAFVTWNENNFATFTSKMRPIKLTSEGNEVIGNEVSTCFNGKEILHTANDEYLVLGLIRNRGPLKYHKGIKRLSHNGELLYHNNLYNPFISDLNVPGLGFDGNSFYKGIVQPDGKILICQQKYSPPSTYTWNLIRLNPDFTVDTGFTSSYNQTVTDIKLQSDGKILLIYSAYPVSNIIRLNTDGSIDNTFISPVFNDRIYSMEVLSNDKIIIGGNFYSVDSGGTTYPTKGFTCLNMDGSFDNIFTLPNIIENAGVYKTSVQNDGKMLLYGSFSVGGFATNYRMIRLNPDFSLDNTFLLDPSISSILEDTTFAPLECKFQADGKIIMVLSNRNNIVYSKLIRLNESGSLDTGFDTGTGFNRRINSIYIQDDGNIVVSGEFTKYNGTWCNGTVRLIAGNVYVVNGNIKLDSNLNGCNASDLNYTNLKFNLGSNQYIANNTGSYSMLFSEAGTYNITPILENPNYFTISPSSITANFPSQISPILQNFCVAPNGTHPDLEVILLPLEAARPGFDAKYKLVYKNKGNQIQSGTIGLTFDDTVLDLVSATPVVASQVTNSLSWNFANLNPMESREILITLNLNSPIETPALNAGGSLNYTTNVTSPQTDETPIDNVFEFHQMAVNSYDPNDKTCLEGLTVGTDKVGEYAHYVIRFENTGNYAAQNITVKDVIDTNKFDITTLVPLNGSALFTTKISEGNKVEFKFDNINLSSAVGTNTGYVAFKIKTKSTLVSGDTFGGNAGIYFDYNSAITTNTYTTTIQALSVKDFSFGNYFNLYPNPVSDILNISKKDDIEISSIHIYNVMGQLMMVIPNAKNTATIDVSNLASGNYFVKVNSDRGTSNTKFIKR